jgi:hypothetical protein
MYEMIQEKELKPSELLNEWERENNHFYPNEMRFDRIRICEIIQYTYKYLTTCHNPPQEESNSDEIREAFEKDFVLKDYCQWDGESYIDKPPFRLSGCKTRADHVNAVNNAFTGYNSALKSQQSLIDEAVELLRDNITEVGYTGYISNRTLQKTEDFLTKIEKDSK